MQRFKEKLEKSCVVLSSTALFMFNQRLFTSAAQKEKEKEKPNADARLLQLLINRTQESQHGAGWWREAHISRIPLWNEQQQFPTGSNFPLIVMDFKATPGTQLSLLLLAYTIPFKLSKR